MNRDNLRLTPNIYFYYSLIKKSTINIICLTIHKTVYIRYVDLIFIE